VNAPVTFGDDDGFVPFLVEGEDAKGEYRCAECGYGAVVAGPLPACPMCRGTAWEETPWSPFARDAATGRLG
jgi:rubredoxin